VLAVLDVIERENLLEHSQKMGEMFEKELHSLMEKHECIGDVRGVGMFWGFAFFYFKLSTKLNIFDIK